MNCVAWAIGAAFLVSVNSGAAAAATNAYALSYRPAPVDNPLKGFFPYAGTYTTFPHSLEWGYLPLRSLMIGPTNFDWTRLDALLNGIAQRGHQTIFRVYLDYPTQPTGIPQFLLDAGLATRSYTDHGNNNVSVSPDYENPLLREALKSFIAAMGARYDGDPRVGFITVGLLGFWGEWHTYPYDWWFASTTVQNEVLTAYERAFVKTKLLVRKPAGTNPGSRRVGYHDDSFAYQTIDPPGWTFLGLLKAAGETNKWKTQPIGGEVRPEIQLCMWDTNQPGCVPVGQEYDTCVDRTHASWMLNHRAFAPGFTGSQKELALAGARRLGYELHIRQAELVDAFSLGPLTIRLLPVNTGVAPFYYDWPVQLGVLDRSNTLVRTWTTPWTLSSLLPGVSNTVWSYTVTNHGLAGGTYKLALSVRNPLTNGVVFHFANQAQGADLAGWLTLGEVAVVAQPAAPTLIGNPVPAGFDLQVRDATPGFWTVEHTADFVTWTQFAATNTATMEWSVTAPVVAPLQFYRVVRPP